MNVLEFDSLYLEFGAKRVLSSIYMKCETGKITALLGRNGSGKSCLMKIVFGALDSEYKSVRVNGTSLQGNYFTKEIISYLPQVHLIPPFLRIQEAINLFRVDAGLIIQSFPEFVGLLKKRTNELSGGQLRFLEVLLILHSRHPFCILDEPFSGLMPLHIEKLQQILSIAKSNKGILITDHLHRHVRSISDDLYVLNQGKTYFIKEEQQLIDLGYLTTLS